MEVDAGMVVLYCFIFIALLLLVLILNSNNSSSVTYVNQNTSAQSMVKLVNPFSVQLHTHERTTLRNVECTIRSNANCFIRVFWGVGIIDLFSALQIDYSSLLDQMMENTLLRDASLSCSELIQEQSCDKIFKFEPEDVIDAAVLGESLRQRYPVVIVILLADPRDITAQVSVVGLISAVHIKDPLVQLDTHLIGQYLKLSDNRVCSLSNLYASSAPSVNEGETLCVVCQTELASMATLPCRHLCTCQNCFSQLQRCPMCRSLIHSYFITRA